MGYYIRCLLISEYKIGEKNYSKYGPFYAFSDPMYAYCFLRDTYGICCSSPEYLFYEAIMYECEAEVSDKGAFICEKLLFRCYDAEHFLEMASYFWKNGAEFFRLPAPIGTVMCDVIVPARRIYFENVIPEYFLKLEKERFFYN
jgi:hypothetical protein